MSKIIRKKPRIAGKNRVFFDRFGRPISIRNAPSARKIRREWWK